MVASETNNFINVWLTAIASACYCYTLSVATQSGVLRLILVLPVICIFTALPFFLSSYHLGGNTFFFLVWLGNFKLLLFSAGLGPLSEPLSLAQFVCTILFPIKVKSRGSQKNQNYPNNSPTRKQDPEIDPLKKTGSGADPSAQVNGPSTNGASITCNSNMGRYVLFVVKCLAFAAIIESYNYKNNLPYSVLLGLYCCHIYLFLEMVLVVVGSLAWATLRLELAPQVNEPYLTTSLQDFWGRRWNLMVSDILRQTIHNPIRSAASPLIGKKWAIVVGVLASFVVSGLMHEFIYYYFTRVNPTWEVTCFFILHGVCTVIEVLIKNKVAGKWRLHRALSGPLTVGFVVVTAVWLFLPQLLRNKVHEKVIDEYPMMVNFVKSNLLYWLWH